MQLPRFSILVTAAVAVVFTGCRSTVATDGETSTGLPYRPPGVMRYVDTPQGFEAPVPGEPLTSRRYLPPTPELEPVPPSFETRSGTGVGAAAAGPALRTKGQTAIEISLPQNEWVQAASTWRGAPYREGGTSREGVDCSGLVQQLYKEVRHQEIPRTTTEQWDRSVSTGVGVVQPGDLVFFTTRRIFGDETSHVGVIVGNRVFAHASTSAGVTYGSLDDPYWSKRFVGSRRFEQ